MTPSAWHERYRLFDNAAIHAASAHSFTPIIESLLTHRSVRAYTQQPVPESAWVAMMAAAQSAATSSNLQVWSAVAVRDAARKERLSVLAGDQAHIRQCPLFVVWLADLSRLARVAQGEGTEPLANDYLEMALMATIDATLAAQNAVVAAESMGLGTVYIGGIRNHPVEVAQELGLPPGVFAVVGLCVGYPAPEVPATVRPRLPQHVVAFHEQYGVPPETEAAAVQRYNDAMNQYQAAVGMKPNRWSRLCAQRVQGPETMNGRDQLRAALNALGFALK